MLKYCDEALLVASVGLLVTAWLSWWVIFPFFLIVFLMTVLTMSVQRKGKLGPLGPVVGVTGIVLVILFYLIIALYDPTGKIKSFFWGLPAATAVLVYGLNFLPILLGIVYALVFDRWILRAEDLEEVKKYARKNEVEEGVSESV